MTSTTSKVIIYEMQLLLTAVTKFAISLQLNKRHCHDGDKLTLVTWLLIENPTF